MDDWTRMYVGDEIAQAGYQGPVVLGEAVSGGASVVVCEATRRGAAVMFAFGFEELDDGERMPSEAIRAPYRRGRHAAGTDQPGDPWLAFGGWCDLDPDLRVIIGKVRDPQATTCRVISSAQTKTLPVRDGLVIGWIEAGRDVRFEVV